MSRKGKQARAARGKPLDENRSLELLSLTIGMDVLHAVQASIIRAAVDLLFHGKRSDFWTNPANTLTYQALGDLEKQSAVHIHERLKNENGVYSLPATLRRAPELRFHRLAASHPALIRWNDPEMQRFFDDSGHYLDLKAARIWDLQRSVNEHLIARGLQPHVDSVPVTLEMAFIANLILRLSLIAEAIPAIPSEAETFRSLEGLRDRWLAFLVEKSSSKWERPPRMRATRRPSS